MKRVLFLFLAFVAVAAMANNKKVTLTFDEKDFIFKQKDGVYSISTTKYDYDYSYKSSDPALPFILVNVLIGSQEEYVSVNSTYDAKPLLRGVSIRHNPLVVPTNWTGTMPKGENEAYESSIYPETSIKCTGVSDVDGYRYVSFLVCPFLFEPRNGVLTLKTKMVLDIQLNQDALKKPIISTAGSRMRDYVSRRVINPEEIDSLYSVTPSAPSRTNNADIVQYLIITTEELKPAFEKLAMWKTIKGVKTRVKTIEEIFEDESLGFNLSNIQKMKYTIRDYCRTKSTNYFLLGGDVDIVPCKPCSIYYVNMMIPTTTPCDLFFSNLDDNDMDWQRNEGLNESIYEKRIPNVSLTRLSVNSLADAEMQVARIIEYEKNPNTSIWPDSILMVGNVFQGYDQHYSPPRSDMDIESRSFYDRIKLDYHFQGDCFHLYDTSTDYPEDSLYQLTGDHLLETMERGFQYIRVTTHGDSNRCKLEDNSSFYKSHAEQFNNPAYSLILTSACFTNAIDSTCLSEAFMRNPNSGILAYWGSSREGFGTKDNTAPDSYYGASERYELYYFRELYDNNEQHFGDIVRNIKTTMAGLDMSYNMPYRWLNYSINPLGDPEMPIYKERPKDLGVYGVYYLSGGELLFDYPIDSNPNPINACVMSLDDMGESYYEIIPDIYHNSIILPTINCSICLTRKGFKPYVINILRGPYVQNETFADKTFVISDGVLIGSDVTDQKPQGPVVIESNSFNIFSPNGVTIKNNFEVKPDATLTIDPSRQFTGFDHPLEYFEPEVEE